jgi:hypothetical protein
MDKKILLSRPFIREILYFLVVLWLVFVILEIIFPNIILAYFNINYLFSTVLFFGIVLLIKK